MRRSRLEFVLIVAAGFHLVSCSGSDRGGTSGTLLDAGSGSGTNRDAGTDQLAGFTEYGSGEYAILLSGDTAPRRYCWYIEETVRICGGGGSPTRDDYVRNVCYDDEFNCLARQPEDSENETSTCWTRITYDNVSRGPLYGTCDRVDAYFLDDPATECLYHRHCPDGMVCADYQCFCPPGVTCSCSECGAPSRPRCEGDVLVTQRLGNGCDEAGRCFYDEIRLDCQASGQRCDPSMEACVSAQEQPDAGVARDGGSGSGRDGGDVECRVAADCPPPGPTPIGLCATVDCDEGVCVETVEAC